MGDLIKTILFFAKNFPFLSKSFVFVYPHDWLAKYKFSAEKANLSALVLIPHITMISVICITFTSTEINPSLCVQSGEIQGL